MSSQQNVATIDRMTNAIFENDRNTLSEVLTPDVQFHVRGALPHAGDYTGVDAFLGAMGTLFEATGGDVKIEQLFVLSDGQWAAEWERAALGRNGQHLEANNVFVYQFDGGRIAEMWMICAAPAGSESFWN